MSQTIFIRYKFILSTRNSNFLLNVPKFIYHAGGFPIHYIIQDFFEGTI